MAQAIPTNRPPVFTFEVQRELTGQDYISLVDCPIYLIKPSTPDELAQEATAIINSCTVTNPTDLDLDVSFAISSSLSKRYSVELTAQAGPNKLGVRGTYEGNDGLVTGVYFWKNGVLDDPNEILPFKTDYPQTDNPGNQWTAYDMAFDADGDYVLMSNRIGDNFAMLDLTGYGYRDGELVSGAPTGQTRWERFPSDHADYSLTGTWSVAWSPDGTEFAMANEMGAANNGIGDENYPTPVLQHQLIICNFDRAAAEDARISWAANQPQQSAPQSITSARQVMWFDDNTIYLFGDRGIMQYTRADAASAFVRNASFEMANTAGMTIGAQGGGPPTRQIKRITGTNLWLAATSVTGGYRVRVYDFNGTPSVWSDPTDNSNLFNGSYYVFDALSYTETSPGNYLVATNLTVAPHVGLMTISTTDYGVQIPWSPDVAVPARCLALEFDPQGNYLFVGWDLPRLTYEPNLPYFYVYDMADPAAPVERNTQDFMLPSFPGRPYSLEFSADGNLFIAGYNRAQYGINSQLDGVTLIDQAQQSLIENGDFENVTGMDYNGGFTPFYSQTGGIGVDAIALAGDGVWTANNPTKEIQIIEGRDGFLGPNEGLRWLGHFSPRTDPQDDDSDGANIYQYTNRSMTDGESVFFDFSIAGNPVNVRSWTFTWNDVLINFPEENDQSELVTQRTTIIKENLTVPAGTTIDIDLQKFVLRSGEALVFKSETGERIPVNVSYVLRTDEPTVVEGEFANQSVDIPTQHGLGG